MALPEFIFSPKGAGGLPTYEALEQRRRIAAAILARRSERPTTIGQGIASLGEAIGDRRLLDQAEEAEAALSKYSAGKVPTLSAPDYVPYDPAGGSTPAAPATRSISPTSALPTTGETAAGNPVYADNAESPLDTLAVPGGVPTPPPQVGRVSLNPEQRQQFVEAVKVKAAETGLNPVDVAKTMLYETGGTLDPNQPGPVTKWGQHRGLIQMGQPQMAQHGYDPKGGVGPAVASSFDYLQANGLKPGMPFADMYSTVNAGAPGRYGASDARYGGKGTVADKVNGIDMAMYGQQAEKLLGSRDGIAATLAAQQQPPVQVASLDPQAGAGSPPPPATAAGAQQAPVQVAQAGPATGIQKAPQGPAPAKYLPSMTPDMQRLLQAANDPHLPPSLRQQAAEAFKFQQARIKEINDRLQREREPYVKQELDRQADVEKRRLDAEAAANDPAKRAALDTARSQADVHREEADIVARTGMKPVDLYKRLDDEKASVEQTLKAQDAQRLARKAIKDGVITGYGANMKLAGAKFADWAWKNGLQGDLAANTEIMQSALTVGLSEAIKTVNGEGGQGVSNTDVKVAMGMAGSDPNLQAKTIQTIMDRAAEINHRKIDSYERKIDKFLSGKSSEEFYKISAKPLAQPEHIKEFLEIQAAEPAKAARARERFNAEYGPGAFELELSRYQRAQARRRD